jgi:K(+)-stimulated pyrophosphate-energized sodium pump
MNLVSLLIAPAVVALTYGTSANTGARVAIAAAATLIVVVAIVINKRTPIAMGDDEPGKADAAPTQRNKVSA